MTEFYECVFTAHTRAHSLQTLKIWRTPLCLRAHITLPAIIDLYSTVVNLVDIAYIYSQVRNIKVCGIKRYLFCLGNEWRHSYSKRLFSVCLQNKYNRETTIITTDKGIIVINISRYNASNLHQSRVCLKHLCILFLKPLSIMVESQESDEVTKILFNVSTSFSNFKFCIFIQNLSIQIMKTYADFLWELHYWIWWDASDSN